MRHWILQCNPSRWRIADFLRDGHDLTSWSVNQHIDKLAPGDNVAFWLSGASGGIVAVGEVTSRPVKPGDTEEDDPYDNDPPDPAARWALPIRITRWFLDNPVGRDTLRADPAFADSQIVQRPYASNPFPLTDTEWRVILHRSAGRGSTGSTFLPAEALTTGTDLLRRLIGQSLHTVTGRPNTILSVTPPSVTVATTKSPAGQRVPIQSVDDALNRLVRDGHVVINPISSTHRSSFIGAVLLTLPGAHHAGSPPTITLREPTPTDPGENTITFGGDLSRTGTTRQRREQAVLRQTLFGNATEAACALCGGTYPVQLLRAAHIKKRAVCTDTEARDLANIAMPACLFGCDALFEAGYIAVDHTGRVVAASAPESLRALSQCLRKLAGRRVAAHTATTAGYFAWHHGNTFRR